MNRLTLSVLALTLAGCNASLTSLIVYLSNFGTVASTDFADTCDENFTNTTCFEEEEDTAESPWTYEFENEGTPGEQAYSVHFGPQSAKSGDAFLVKGDNSFSGRYWYDGKNRIMVFERIVVDDNSETRTHESGYTWSNVDNYQRTIRYNLTASADGRVTGFRESAEESESVVSESDLWDPEEVSSGYANFCSSLERGDDEESACVNDPETADCDAGTCTVTLTSMTSTKYDLDGFWLDDNTDHADVRDVGQPEGGANW